MSKSSTAISLVLLTAASAGFIGYKAVHSPPDPAFPSFDDNGDDNTGGDFGDDLSDTPSTNPSTQPFYTGPNSSRGYSNYYRRRHYYTGYTRSFSPARSGESYSGGSYSSGARSSASHSSGTSRGGFGSTGHAMGHAGS